MRYGDISRILHNKKASRTTIGKGEPSQREGSDGDMSIREITGKGIFLFVKYNNNWYSRVLFDGAAEIGMQNPGRTMQLFGWNPDSKAYTLLNASEVFELNYGSPGKLTLGSRKASTIGGGTGNKGQLILGDDSKSSGVLHLGKGSAGVSTIAAGMIDSLNGGLLRILGGYHLAVGYETILTVGSTNMASMLLKHVSIQSPYGPVLALRECENLASDTELITDSKNRDFASASDWVIYDPESTSFTFGDDGTPAYLEITGTTSEEKQGAELGTSYFTTLVPGNTYQVSVKIWSTGSISDFTIELGGVTNSFAISTSTTAIVKDYLVTADSALRIYYQNASETQWFIDDVSIRKVAPVSTNTGGLYVERQSTGGDGVLKFRNAGGDISTLSSTTGGLDGYLPLAGGTVTGTLILDNAGVTGTPSTAGKFFAVAPAAYIDDNTADGGTAANFYGSRFSLHAIRPSSGSITTTNAATVYIEGPSTAGTGQTITNNYALWVDDGASRFDGNVQLANSGKVIFGDAEEYIMGDGATLFIKSTNNVDFDGSRVIGVQRLTFEDGGSTIDIVRDEDDMASDDNMGVATQQSIKAYVDSSSIIGYTHIYNNSIIANSGRIEVAGATPALLTTVGGTNLSVIFTAPPSTNVEVSLTCLVSSTNDYLRLGLSESNSSYTSVTTEGDYNEFVHYADESDMLMMTVKWVLTGLSSGKTYYVWGSTNGSFNKCYIYHGKNYHHSSTYYNPPIIIKATTLPSVITTGN
jgi:hypothetical protein